MSKTIVLAVDAARHVSAAADMARELSWDSGDRVIALTLGRRPEITHEAIPAAGPRGVKTA